MRGPRLFPNPRFYGWVIVGTGFAATALSSPGQSFLLGLYLERFEAAAGISRVELASLYATATLAAALVLPLAGRLLDRVPSRFGLTASSLMALGALASTLLPLPVGMGVLVFGPMLGATAGMASAANRQIWPDYFGLEALGAIRGTITAIRNAAAAAGPPLLAWVSTTGVGPRGLGTLAAVAAVGVVLPLLLRPPVR